MSTIPLYKGTMLKFSILLNSKFLKLVAVECVNEFDIHHGLLYLMKSLLIYIMNIA